MRRCKNCCADLKLKNVVCHLTAKIASKLHFDSKGQTIYVIYCATKEALLDSRIVACRNVEKVSQAQLWKTPRPTAAAVI